VTKDSTRVERHNAIRHRPVLELAEHPDFRDNTARMKNKAEVHRRLNGKFADRPRMEWTKELVKLGLPTGPIYNIAEVFADPQVQHLGLAETVDHPVLGDLRQLANPVRLESFEGGSVRSAPPVLGQHSEAALHDYGLSADRIAKLRDAGTIKQEEG
jgi:crotonobetainyl-CoA:carnitine CoA-transferase CaiB-like acyl-CoA transferase